MHTERTNRRPAGVTRMPWASKVHLHISQEGTRAAFDQILSGYQPGWHVYTCGAAPYMEAVITAAEAAGFPEDARHLEYFSVPEQPEYENHPFVLRLARSGREIHVSAEQTATDALAEQGIHVDVKCADGICGVCKCGLVSGDVEHRDFVLSKAQQETEIVTCQSRAAPECDEITLDL